jgi:hypothetical protein
MKKNLIVFSHLLCAEYDYFSNLRRIVHSTTILCRSCIELQAVLQRIHELERIHVRLRKGLRGGIRVVRIVAIVINEGSKSRHHGRDKCR